MVKLNLVVVRCADVERAKAVYQALGLTFEHHAHGSGPMHYTWEGDGVVFELYPLTDAHAPTTGTRVGFAVDDVDRAVHEAVGAGATIAVHPKLSPWGRRAVIVDLDGHAVELTEVSS